MQVILLEKVGKLGEVGSVANVRDGFARNYLLPRNKAMRATKANLEMVEKKREELVKENLARKAEAEKIAEKITGMNLTIISQAGDDGRLYGSISTKEIARVISEKSNLAILSEVINLPFKIKEIGIYNVEVRLHSDVSVFISLNVARSESEAKTALKKNTGSESEKIENDKKKPAAKKSKDEVAG